MHEEFPVEHSPHPTVLIVTDSLGYPRGEPESLPYQKTYIALLKRRFPQIDFIHHGRGGVSIDELWRHCSYYRQALAPDAVIMHCGVVDCAPRALTRIEAMALNHIRPIKVIFGPLVVRNKARLRRLRNIRYTKPARFRAVMNEVEKRFGRVWWIGIPPAVPEWEEKETGITESVNIYNTILGERDLISVTDFGSDVLMADHHHLNARGHAKIFERLCPRVETLLSRNDFCE